LPIIFNFFSFKIQLVLKQQSPSFNKSSRGIDGQNEWVSWGTKTGEFLKKFSTKGQKTNHGSKKNKKMAAALSWTVVTRLIILFWTTRCCADQSPETSHSLAPQHTNKANTGGWVAWQHTSSANAHKGTASFVSFFVCLLISLDDLS
jgi:hypothetical protein